MSRRVHACRFLVVELSFHLFPLPLGRSPSMPIVRPCFPPDGPAAIHSNRTFAKKIFGHLGSICLTGLFLNFLLFVRYTSYRTALCSLLFQSSWSSRNNLRYIGWKRDHRGVSPRFMSYTGNLMKFFTTVARLKHGVKNLLVVLLHFSYKKT